MPHHDSPKALHDSNPARRPAMPRLPPVALDVDRLAKRAAATLRRRPRDEWPALERIYVERLRGHLEERHEPAEIDASRAPVH